MQPYCYKYIIYSFIEPLYFIYESSLKKNILLFKDIAIESVLNILHNFVFKPWDTKIKIFTFIFREYR